MVSANVIPETQFKAATRGKLHGAGKGARYGFSKAIQVPCADLACIIVLPVVAGATIIGAGSGAFLAESGSEVKKAEAALNKALGELKVQETFPDRVLQVARDQTRHNFVFLQDQAPYSSLADKGVDTVLEIGVERVGLVGPSGTVFNPPLMLVVSVHASLIRISDGTKLYRRPWTNYSRKRKFTYWAGDDAQPLREEVDRAYLSLAERIVEDLFLLFYIP